jgi:hypothetical protein
MVPRSESDDPRSGASIPSGAGLEPDGSQPAALHNIGEHERRSNIWAALESGIKPDAFTMARPFGDSARRRRLSPRRGQWTRGVLRTLGNQLSVEEPCSMASCG